MKKLVSLVVALSMAVTASVCGAAQETSVEPSSSVKISSVSKTGNKNKMNKKAIVATVVGSIVAAATIAASAVLIYGAVKDKKEANIKDVDNKSKEANIKDVDNKPVDNRPSKKSEKLKANDFAQNCDNIRKETIGNKTGKVLASITLIPAKAVKVSKEFISEVKQGYGNVSEIKERKEIKKVLNVKKQSAEKAPESSTIGKKVGKFFAAVTLVPTGIFKATKGFISEVKQGYNDVPKIKMRREAAKNSKDQKEINNQNNKNDILDLEVNVLEEKE